MLNVLGLHWANLMVNRRAFIPNEYWNYIAESANGGDVGPISFAFIGPMLDQYTVGSKARRWAIKLAQ